MKARCSGCGRSAVPRPSTVVTSLSATDQSGMSQADTARSPMMTLQAPHSPAPQPKCVPVMPSCARRISSSERSGSASISVSAPLRRNRTLVIAGALAGGLLLRLLEFLDDFGPFNNIAAQEFVELVRGHRHRNRALLAPELDDIRPFHRGIHRRVELVYNRLRGARRCHQAE